MDSRDFQSIIKCSFIEIYNEQTYDLLEPKRKLPLQIREDFDHSVFIESLTIQSVDSLNESLRVSCYKLTIFLLNKLITFLMFPILF